LAPRGEEMCFASFELATQKFPKSAVTLVRGTCAHEVAVVAHDHGCENPGGHSARRLGLVEVRRFPRSVDEEIGRNPQLVPQFLDLCNRQPPLAGEELRYTCAAAHPGREVGPRQGTLLQHE